MKLQVIHDGKGRIVAAANTLDSEHSEDRQCGIAPLPGSGHVLAEVEVPSEDARCDPRTIFEGLRCTGRERVGYVTRRERERDSASQRGR